MIGLIFTSDKVKFEPTRLTKVFTPMGVWAPLSLAHNFGTAAWATGFSSDTEKAQQLAKEAQNFTNLVGGKADVFKHIGGIRVLGAGKMFISPKSNVESKSLEVATTCSRALKLPQHAAARHLGLTASRARSALTMSRT